MRLALALGAAIGFGCAAEGQIWLAPPWEDEAEGFLLLVDQDGRPLRPEPLFFEGRAPLAFAAPEQDYWIWAEAYPDDQPELSSACPPSFEVGPSMPPGRRYSTATLGPSEGTAVFAEAQGERPAPVYSTCPPAPTICDRVQLQLERPETGTAGVDLYDVAPLGPERWWVSGSRENTGAFLGLLEGSTLTTLYVESNALELGRLAVADGVGYWANTFSGRLYAFDRSGRILRNQVGGGREVSLLDDGTTFTLDGQGRLRRYLGPRGGAQFHPERPGLLALAAEGDQLYAHDGEQLWIWRAGEWRAEAGPEVDFNESKLDVDDGRITLYGPAGIQVREANRQGWRSIPPPFVPLLIRWWRDGLLLSVGPDRDLMVWDQTQWCPLVDILFPSYRGISTTTDRRQAILVGTNNGIQGDPLVVRLTLEPQ